jgi:hypothetical protein
MAAGFDETRHRFGAHVESDNAMLRFHEALGHGRSHGAEADEGDCFRHGCSLSLPVATRAEKH